MVLLILGVAVYFLLSKKKKTVQTEFDEKIYSELIKQAESSGNYQIENSIGALGAYQFMPITLNNLMEMFQLPDWKPKDYFLSHPSLQDLYHSHLVNSNFQALKNSGAENWLGTIVYGSKNPKYINYVSAANWYGLLAGSHLAGVGNVKGFFLNNINKDDGYTSISDYVAYFSTITEKSLV